MAVSVTAEQIELRIKADQTLWPRAWDSPRAVTWTGNYFVQSGVIIVFFTQILVLTYFYTLGSTAYC